VILTYLDYFRGFLRAFRYLAFLILKINFRNLLLIIAAMLLVQSVSAQLIYRSRYKSAILFEGFGLSPIMSVNYEMAPLRYHKSFVSGRVGLGYLPASGGNGAGYSFPVGASYNMLINNLKKGISSRVMNKCKSKPPKFDLEYFLETGVGYSWVVYPSGPDRNYFNLLGAIKAQLVIDTPPKPKVFQVKVSVNPRYDPNKGLLFYEVSRTGGQNFFGGFAIGFSI
jgi:hypothetical protein